MNYLAKTLLFSFVFGLSNQLSAFELKHSEGIVKLASAPETIVSYDLAVLDSLDYLQIPVAGIPELHRREPFQKYAEIAAVGTLFEPDYGELNILKPDLIFAGRRTFDKLNKLNKVAPVAYLATERGRFLSDFKSNQLNLGKAFSKEAAVRDKLAAIEADLAKLHQLNQGQSGVFMMVVDSGKIISQGPNDAMGYVYEVLGLSSALPATTPAAVTRPKPHHHARPHPPIKADGIDESTASERRRQQLQAIAKANPDWLIIMDREQMRSGELRADKMIKAHAVLGAMDAVINDRVIYIDPAKWYLMSGGLNNLHELIKTMLEEMQRH